MSKISTGMIRDYIRLITGESVVIEEIEGVPVIVKEGYYHLYLIPRFMVIGTVTEDELPFICKIRDLSLAIQNIWYEV